MSSVASQLSGKYIDFKNQSLDPIITTLSGSSRGVMLLFCLHRKTKGERCHVATLHRKMSCTVRKVRKNTNNNFFLILIAKWHLFYYKYKIILKDTVHKYCFTSNL